MQHQLKCTQHQLKCTGTGYTVISHLKSCYLITMSGKESCVSTVIWMMDLDQEPTYSFLLAAGFNASFWFHL